MGKTQALPTPPLRPAPTQINFSSFTVHTVRPSAERESDRPCMSLMGLHADLLDQRQPCVGCAVVYIVCI